MLGIWEDHTGQDFDLSQSALWFEERGLIQLSELVSLVSVTESYIKFGVLSRKPASANPQSLKAPASATNLDPNLPLVCPTRVIPIYGRCSRMRYIFYTSERIAASKDPAE
jgi:hypothetical protein